MIRSGRGSRGPSYACLSITLVDAQPTAARIVSAHRATGPSTFRMVIEVSWRGGGCCSRTSPANSPVRDFVQLAASSLVELRQEPRHGRPERREAVESEPTTTREVLDAPREGLERDAGVTAQLQHEGLVDRELSGLGRRFRVWLSFARVLCVHWFRGVTFADDGGAGPDIWLVFFGHFSDSPLSAMSGPSIP